MNSHLLNVFALIPQFSLLTMLQYRLRQFGRWSLLNCLLASRKVGIGLGLNQLVRLPELARSEQLEQIKFYIHSNCCLEN